MDFSSVFNYVYVDFEYILRLVLAAVCGAIVGLEREKRQKSAGLRTHIIVAMASALMMIVSKYGFLDVMKQGLTPDPSRIAAGVVTAIGFLGGGVIFIRKDNAVGLTTAAGLWATVGIGITVGAGMYVIGISCTVLMLLVQIFMHSHHMKMFSQTVGTITVNLSKHNLSVEQLKDSLDKEGIAIRNLALKKAENNDVIFSATVSLSKKYPLTDLISDFNGHDGIFDSFEIYTLS